MLGIRKHNGVAIDIFLGDIGTFASDVRVCEVGNGQVLESSEIETFTISDGNKKPSRWMIHVAIASGLLDSVNELDHIISIYLGSLLNAEKLNARHISIPALPISTSKQSDATTAKVAMATVLEFIEKESPKFLRRITFVLNNKEQYDFFQKQLFATFSEKD